MKSVPTYLADGSMVELCPPASNDESSLAQWLESQALRLNTRCGGRGICRGCEVHLLSAESKVAVVKACQTSASCLLSSKCTGLKIPRASYADQSLSGVSVFDLHLPQNANLLQRKGLGLALDIGTTTLAAALWDLPTGSCLATATLGNPQRRFGDNVISRISFSLETNDALARLQSCLVQEGIVPLVNETSQKSGHTPSEISFIEAAGNPAMLQTLTGDSLEGLSRYPFSLAWSGEREFQASSIGLDLSACIHLLPALGPFVGADIVAGALASGMLDDERTTLLIDFGTNGEMLLHHNGRWFGTATAVGPAFEGGRLRCGTTAHSSSISAIGLGADNRWLLLGGDRKPLRNAQGITGAAYVDFMALGVASQLLTPMGRFNQQHPKWERNGRIEDGEAILFLNRQNFISEADISELMQAKSAMAAGVQVLLELAGIPVSALERLLVAGGFGYYLDLQHAQTIGLLPRVERSRIEVIGNSSLAGASLALQYDVSKRIQPICDVLTLVELNQIPSFSEFYTDCLIIAPFD